MCTAFLSLTSEQVRLAVDELGLPLGAVLLTGRVQHLHEDALLSGRAGHPLVKRCVKGQIELGTVLQQGGERIISMVL